MKEKVKGLWPWTHTIHPVTRVNTFQCVVMELSPEYTPFSVLLLNCHQSTHLTACCYWTDTRIHTFQRVAVTFWAWSVAEAGCTGPKSLHEYDLKGPITTWVWPPCPNHYISITSKSQSPGKYDLQVKGMISMITKEAWLSGSNQLPKYDLGPTSHRSMTSRAQSVTDDCMTWALKATEVWPCGPKQQNMYDLVGPTIYRIMTWAQPVTEVWPSEPSLLQKYGSHSQHWVGDSFHLIESPSYNYNYPDIK